MTSDKEERIKARAYQIWEEEGRPHGRHHDHWQRAAEEDGSDPQASAASGSTAPSHPGMFGDGTEEQNLNQPGDPKARITKGEVEDAFATDKRK